MDRINTHSPYRISKTSVSGYRARNMFYVTSTGGGTKYYLPNPDKDDGLSITIATLVNSARNTKGIVTAQKIGRDQIKYELSWSFLSKGEWESLLSFFNNHFTFKLYYYDPVKARIIGRTCYVSDRTYGYYDIDDSGLPIAYNDCSLSVVDTGEGA